MRAGADERADVHVAHRDHAVERRLDGAVALHLLQARAVRLDRGEIAALREDRLLERLHVGVLRGQLRLILIAFLLRRDPFSTSIFMRSAVMRASSRFALPCARPACACSIDACACSIGRLRLVDLLIELRRVDFGEHLSGRHTVADVGEAAFEVSIGARKNRRLGERLHRAGSFNTFWSVARPTCITTTRGRPFCCASASARSVASRRCIGR